MTSKGSGYSNHGYCNQYDYYGQYEYEQCNNGNIVRNNEAEDIDMYYTQQEEHCFTRRDSPIGANAPTKYVERPVSPPQPRRVTSPNAQRRHTIIVYPRGRGMSPSRVNEIPLPPRQHPQRVVTPVKTRPSYLQYTSTPRGVIKSSPARQNLFQTPNKTAVISPTLYTKAPSPMRQADDSPSKFSWMSAPYQTPPKTTLGAAAILLGVGGFITCVMGLYLLSLDGRKYYLDIACLSGFVSLLLGGLGFRARRWEWLPNRNYVSGYVILSLFILLTTSGLIVMASLRPKPGSPMADLTAGAVCGISVLTLLLASLGLVASHCCKYPPPDNRVEHGVEGLII